MLLDYGFRRFGMSFKVSGAMIHGELRFLGLLVRTVLRFKTEEKFFGAQNLVRKKLVGRKSKKILCEEKTIVSKDGTELRLCIYKPLQAKSGKVPGLLWLHGGGYALGVPEMDIAYMEKLIGAADCVIVSPDYRVSQTAPYPAALEDSYSALLWMKENAESLGIRDDQLFVGGNSAGGGLTAALTLYARDKGEVSIAFQMPLYPMLDDRMINNSAKDNKAPVWDSVSNAIAWKMYLGDFYATDKVPKYASPSRETDYSGIPPTYTFVGTIECFYDETVTYIDNLRNAGVNAKVDEYEGCFHAFDQFGKRTKIGKMATEKFLSEFVYAVEHYFSSQGDKT
jgi:acetyl esterase/lipase